MKKFKVVTIVLGMLLIALIAAASAYFNYYVWCQKHPDAPFWTYFF